MYSLISIRTSSETKNIDLFHYGVISFNFIIIILSLKVDEDNTTWLSRGTVVKYIKDARQLFADKSWNGLRMFDLKYLTQLVAE